MDCEGGAEDGKMQYLGSPNLICELKTLNNNCAECAHYPWRPVSSEGFGIADILHKDVGCIQSYWDSQGQFADSLGSNIRIFCLKNTHKPGSEGIDTQHTATVLQLLPSLDLLLREHQGT